MLELLRPVLTEYGEEKQIVTVPAEILRHGSGARRQPQTGGFSRVIR